MARGVAEGKSIRKAATAAGYAPKSRWIYRIGVRPEFHARVAALEREGPLTGPDMGPVLLALMDGAREAMAKKTGVAWAAAARMLVEAARIKRTVPDTRQADEDRAWLLRWGPVD